MKCIALTGGIATGKSTVSQIIRDAGIPVIDADVLAREIVAPGLPGLNEIVREFGNKYLLPDGSLNRAELAELIFKDPNARHKLEHITHPKIAQLLLEKLVDLASQGVTWAVYEAPLIFEKNLQANFVATILVSCPEKIQLERLMRREGMSEEIAMERISSQMSNEKKISLASVVLDTDCALSELQKRLATIWHELTGENLVSPRKS